MGRTRTLTDEVINGAEVLEQAVRFVVPNGVASSNQVAELVRAMLKGIGVRVDILSVPTQAFFKQYILPPGTSS